MRFNRKELYERLAEIVGQENVTTEEVDLYCYSADQFLRGLSYYFRDFKFLPDAVVTPETTEQISKILQFADEKKIPIIPRGAGTSLAGQLIPVKGGIVLDLKRMNKIKEINVADKIAIMEPGVTYKKLNEELRKVGYFFPPEPGSAEACAIGGMVSTNASGMCAVKYGTTKNYVLGLEIVLPSGEVIRTGGRALKTSSGYDLTSLFVGSEGTLGVITEITLKIEPYPKFRATSIVSFEKMDEAYEAALAILTAGITPASIELIDGLCTVAINMSGFKIPETEAALLLRSDGGDEGGVNKELAAMHEICKQRGCSNIEVIKDDGVAKKLWDAREKISASLTKFLPPPEEPRLVFQSSVDVAVPLSKMLTYMKEISELAQQYGVMYVSFGHVGDGNVHIGSTFTPDSPQATERARIFQRKAIESALKLGGTITAEHGIGLWKAPYLELERKEALEVMRLIKRALDPNNIMNPGKMALDEIPDLAKMETWYKESVK